MKYPDLNTLLRSEPEAKRYMSYKSSRFRIENGCFSVLSLRNHHFQKALRHNDFQKQNSVSIKSRPDCLLECRKLSEHGPHYSFSGKNIEPTKDYFFMVRPSTANCARMPKTDTKRR